VAETKDEKPDEGVSQSKIVNGVPRSDEKQPEINYSL
jgi:hypothetical protein